MTVLANRDLLVLGEEESCAVFCPATGEGKVADLPGVAGTESTTSVFSVEAGIVTVLIHGDATVVQDGNKRVKQRLEDESTARRRSLTAQLAQRNALRFKLFGPDTSAQRFEVAISGADPGWTRSVA